MLDHVVQLHLMPPGSSLLRWLGAAAGPQIRRRRRQQQMLARRDEDPVAAVTAADVGCAYATPLRIEPERGQVPEYTSEGSESRLSCKVSCSHTSRAGFQRANG